MDERVLDLFHPATARWFHESFGEPTPPQELGWPRIAEGRNTLILAPTGSGKTLAAFLYAIDELLRRPGSAEGAGGVHTLYLSPLKALANDIERNLEAPLRGIRACATAMGAGLPEIRVGLRTGDTPSNERQRMVRNPPDLLVTTPESLHLLLTSVRARDMLRTVRYVIVDEIHALCPSKRGTFLALLLERLEALVPRSPIRIGLSATQKPLDEVARFLGGFDKGAARPVEIVDAGLRKDLDLKVISPVEDMADLPRAEDGTVSIWPAIYERLLELASQNTSTLVFANSRRVVERLAAELNRRAGEPLARAHHGSVSKEERHRIERDLKAGRLPVLVATASMELGIDVGTIDLVCQVEAPFSVASGLQRVGRAGHLVRATSVGRLLPKTRADLLVTAAMTRSMRRGEISSIRIPHHPLDLLAQQIVAMVAMDAWRDDELYERVRGAAPYADLPREAFDGVLEMLGGRYRSSNTTALRPRISWERSSGNLYPMPGSRQSVVLNGGAIPDTGQYAMVLEDGVTRLGELDEEFVFERRLGETFILGTGRWRITEIRHDRVLVSPTEEREVIMPFWKGEGLGRDAEFGARFGAFLRSCEKRLPNGTLESWLQDECQLDEAASSNLATYLSDQKQAAVLPNDRRILIDVFLNETGDPRMALLSPFGRAFHHALLLGIQAKLREQGRPPVDAIYAGDGILFRPGGLGTEGLLAAIRALRSEEILTGILGELEHSSFFALRFRRNAGRALLLPKAKPGRRTPLWLQRLRAHDLLSEAVQHPDFPIIRETYRGILEDELPLEAVADFLRSVERGAAEVVVRKARTPCPFTTSLLLDFTGKYLYEEDRPVPSGRSPSRMQEDLSHLLDGPEARGEVLDRNVLSALEDRLQGLAEGARARNGTELVELVRRLGGLGEKELRLRLEEAASSALTELLEDGRIVRVRVPNAREPERMVAADDVEAFERMGPEDAAELLGRFVASKAIVSAEEIREVLPAAAGCLEDIAAAEGWVKVLHPEGWRGWMTPANLASARRLSMARDRRRRQDPVAPEAYARFLLEHQHIASPLPAESAFDVLEQLAGCLLPVRTWPMVLRLRVAGFGQPALAELVRRGELVWYGEARGRGARRVGFAPEGLLQSLGRPTVGAPPEGLAARVHGCLSERGASFLQRIAREIGEAPSQVAEALWDLSWRGLVTNDELAPAWGAKPCRTLWDGRARGGWVGGRWSALPEPLAVRSEEAMRGLVRTILHRYGIINRELCARDGVNLRWAEAYSLLARMEWAGRVERGFFVAGLSTPQFSLPGLDARLRAAKADAPVLLPLVDPACVHGSLFPIHSADGERLAVRRLVGNHLVVEGGRPLLLSENRARRLTPLVTLEPAARRRCLSAVAGLVQEREEGARLRVETWGSRNILSSAAVGDLEGLGFVKENRAMILYRSYDMTSAGNPNG